MTVAMIEHAPARKDVLVEALDGCAPLLAEYLPQAEPVRAELLRQRQEQRPEVLVFGAYNAGKSTLINALLGAEHAPVGDVPTTASVDRYDYGLCMLVDTPGVNAPIEHDETTREALRSAHLVMFIVREGDQDVADLYTRLFELLAAGSDVQLVLNHSMTQAEDVEELRQHMLTILDDNGRRHGCDEALLDRLPVLPVNAKLALRGKLEGKQNFLAVSGLEDLGFGLIAWLEHVEATGGWEQRIARRSLSELLEPLREQLQQRADTPQELVTVGEQLKVMSGGIDRLETQLRSLVRGNIQGSKGDIGSALDASAEKLEQLEAQMQVIAERGLEQLVECLVAGVDNLGEQLELSHRQANLQPPDLAKLLSESSGILGQLESMLGKTGVGALKQVKPEHLVEAMKWLRSMKVPFFKGRWEKTFAKWAGKYAPWLIVLAGAVDLTLEVRAQSRHNQQQRIAVMQRMQLINELAASIQAAHDQFVDEQIAELRTYLLAPLQAEHERLQQQQGDIAGQAEQVHGWEIQVQRLAGHGSTVSP